MDLFSLHKKKKNPKQSIFSSRNNLPKMIKTSQKTIESYIEKLNLAGLNNDVDLNSYLNGQFNSEINIINKYSEKKNNTTDKYSRKYSFYPSFHTSKNSSLTQFKILFQKKNKLSISPIKTKKKLNCISPLRLDYYSLNNNNKKTNTIIPNIVRRNQKEFFLTLSENNDSYNYKSQNNNGFSIIHEHNKYDSDKRIYSKYNTQKDFFKNKKNMRQKTLNNLFKKAELFDLKKAKKKQKIKLIGKNKINIRKKYQPEIFNKLINILKANIKKTNNITKEMIGESINLKKIDNNIEDIEMIDMKHIEKLRNSEKIPKLGSTGQINMVNRAYSNLMDFGDDYLKLDDIDFYKRKNEIMKKYQNIRINAEVEEKPEESDKRYKILNRNNFIIKKKLDALIRETVKFIDIVNHN